MKPATAEEKIPGGKLVRISVRPDGCVTISGDFFMHPEESITLIEDQLSRLEGNEPVSEIERQLSRLVTGAGIQLIGIEISAIVRLYRRCRICGE